MAAGKHVLLEILPVKQEDITLLAPYEKSLLLIDGSFRSNSLSTALDDPALDREA